MTRSSLASGLNRRFYERLEDFNAKVLLHKEPGYEVYRAKCSYSGGIVVLKGYGQDVLTPENRERITREVEIMQDSECPFLTKCFDAFEDQGWWWLVLESCAGGDLYHLTQRCPVSCRDEGWLVSQVVLPLLQTLAHLHEQGIIHRDVKPENVLFNSEKVAKLGGFFLCWDMAAYGPPTDIVGTLDYMAPELFEMMYNPPDDRPELYDAKVDVWATGVLVYDIVCGRPPFEVGDPNTTVSNILDNDPELPNHLSEDAKDFLLQALTKDPLDRPDAVDLLSHEWVMHFLDWEPSPFFEDPVPSMAYIAEYYSSLNSDEAGRSRSRCWPLSSLLSPTASSRVAPEPLQGGVLAAVRSGVAALRERLWGPPLSRSSSDTSRANLLPPDDARGVAPVAPSKDYKRSTSKVSTDAVQLPNGTLKVELTPRSTYAKKLASMQDPTPPPMSPTDSNIPAGTYPNHPTHPHGPPSPPFPRVPNLDLNNSAIRPISPIAGDSADFFHPHPEPSIHPSSGSPKPSDPHPPLLPASPTSPASPSSPSPPAYAPTINLLTLSTPHATSAATATHPPGPSPPPTVPIPTPSLHPHHHPDPTLPAPGPQNILILEDPSASPDPSRSSHTSAKSDDLPTLPSAPARAPPTSLHPPANTTPRSVSGRKARPWLGDNSWAGAQPPGEAALVLPLAGSQMAATRQSSKQPGRPAEPGKEGGGPGAVEFDLAAILNEDD